MTAPHSESSASTEDWAVKPDIEIARSVTPQSILLLAQQRLGLPPESLIPFGHFKAKVDVEQVDTHNHANYGKLVLVTAVTPTPAGEGKTTTSVGLNDALNRLGHKSRRGDQPTDIVCQAHHQREEEGRQPAGSVHAAGRDARRRSTVQHAAAEARADGEGGDGERWAA